MEDGREMVEEYHLETNVLIRRAWKEKGKLGQDVGWKVEIGDPEPRQSNIEVYGIEESSSTVCIVCFAQHKITYIHIIHIKLYHNVISTNYYHISLQ